MMIIRTTPSTYASNILEKILFYVRHGSTSNLVLNEMEQDLVDMDIFQENWNNDP